jgi:ABC-type nitrate/sulfonate/bicarbonate transport system substrate-binding protein
MRFQTLRLAAIAASAGAFLAVSAGAPALSQQLEEVDAIIAGAINNVAMMVAADNGYWREQGLDVRLQTLDTGSQIAKALLSGAADVGAGNATSSIPLSRASGSNLTFVAPYHNNPTVVNGVQRVGVIARTDSGAKEGEAASLVGKTVGVSLGSTGDNYLRGFLTESGVSPDDLNMVNLGVPEMPTALRQGTVDAVSTWEPYVSQIIREQADDVTVVVRGGPYGASVVGIVVTDEYFANNKDTLKKYVVGAWKGMQFTRQNPEAAAQIAQRYIRDLNPVDAASGIAFMKDEFDPRISPCTEEAIMQEQRALIEAGRMNVSEPMPYDAIVQVEFINQLLSENADLVSDLAPLPASLDECGGKLKM